MLAIAGSTASFSVVAAAGKLNLNMLTAMTPGVIRMRAHL